MCLADTRMFLPGLNLTYTDRASMAASAEVRVPFVDPLVFEAAFSLEAQDRRFADVLEGRAQGSRTDLAPGGDRAPAESFLSAPLRAWVSHDLEGWSTTRWSAASWYRRGCCAERRAAAHRGREGGSGRLREAGLAVAVDGAVVPPGARAGVGA